ncbi:MAG: AraC family transcriptional regulator [Bacteroidaceae bacterium]|nr:AraC family transcriptional regulator [Bacteroidaceae bacterium]
MATILDMKSVQDYNNDLGVKTLHPLVSVVDMSELPQIRHSLKRFGFYCIFLKQLECGSILYGRRHYDYQEGTMLFIAPGQVAGVDDGGVTTSPRGWILMFHPDLLHGTPLAQHLREYSFFHYTSNEALHTSERERQVIIGCMREIREEIERPIDKHSKRIITSNIELLLNHCIRFYDRQFITREVVNHDVLSRFEALLNEYFCSGTPTQTGLPTVAWFAEKLCLSANYFGDLIKRETGMSAQEYIQNHIIERAKQMLADDCLSVSEVAYALGYKYPHHLSRIFKKVTGYSPNEFRQQI